MTCHGCCSWGCHLNHRNMHRPQHTHKARFGWYNYISKTSIKILYNVIYNTRFTRCKNLYNLTNRKYFCVKCDYVNQLSWIITFLDYNDKIIRQQKLIQSKYLHTFSWNALTNILINFPSSSCRLSSGNPQFLVLIPATFFHW